MNIKQDIIWRVNLLFYLACVVGLGILAQAFKIQYFEGEKWMAEGAKTTMTDTIEGPRGKILDAHGELLATSLTYYKVSIDPSTSKDEDFNQNIGGLSSLLSKTFKDKSAAEYKRKITSARESKKRYLTLQHSVDYNLLQEMKEWPLFSLGQYKGGLVTESFNKRVLPYGRPAARTIGLQRPNVEPVGLEGSYGDVLRGPQIGRILERMPDNEWVRRFDIEHKGESGKDIRLTIDMAIQDIVDTALEKALIKNKAEHGCAVVMEVATGKIKAISNLGMQADSTYWERYNYAVGKSTEPGSTFKLMSTLALLESGSASLSEKVDIHTAEARFYDKVIKDAHPIYMDSLSLEQSFIKSSNVAISKLVDKHFGKRETYFTEFIEQFKLHEKTGISITGEPTPFIKKPQDKKWTGVTLPYMSMGYELSITPLQTLRFFNAIANGGELMRPYLVESVEENNRITERFDPVNEGRICSAKNAAIMRQLCKDVVEVGTAKSIRSDLYSMAGKTGTAKFMDKKLDKKKKVYQASFAGFFPANDPIFSCIVVVHAPRKGKIYGGEIAAPVFKDVVEKYLSLNYEMRGQDIIEEEVSDEWADVPQTKTGEWKDWLAIAKQMDVPVEPRAETEFVESVIEADSIRFINRIIRDDEIPNVMGMGLRDAVYLLEKNGYQVRFNGVGKVTKQTPKGKVETKNPKTVVLELG